MKDGMRDSKTIVWICRYSKWLLCHLCWREISKILTSIYTRSWNTNGESSH